MADTTLSLDLVAVTKPDDVNVIIGQSHFIKTVEDLHEVLAGSSPRLRFGIAFCESSGPRPPVRNDDELVELATANAVAIGAGHRSSCSFARDARPESPGGLHDLATANPQCRRRRGWIV
jgi:adenosine/AMP kinase